MHLITFGGLALEGRAFTRPKPLTLATYLAIEGRQDRRFVAELFWPDARDPRKSLTVALSRLRKGAPGAIEADATHAWANVGSDAERFLELLENDRAAEALALYRGPFLDGVRVQPRGPELEEWIVKTREFFAGHARRAILASAERDAARDRFRDAASGAERAYRMRGAPALDPDALTRLQAMLLAGESPLAATAAEELDDLGLAPFASRDAARDHLRAALAISDAPPANNLPDRATAFVGRDLERTELASLLVRSDVRLVSLVGTPGVGKTDLALQVAREQLKLHAFEDGVFVVPLGGLVPGAPVAGAIAEAFDLDLDVDPNGSDAQFAELRAHIGDRELLLVVDNVEHVIEAGAPRIVELLRACPNLTVLVTSRERLNVRGERAFPLAGLPVPEDDRLTPEAALRFDAVRLFVRRARRARPDFVFDAAAVPAVVAICRTVEGLPLGLELAAVSVRFLSVAEVAEETATSLDVLTTRTRDVPERHRSVRSAFEHSWTRLAPEERAVMRALSVFRGGFRRDAAGEVAGATIPLLASLVDKSLLRVDAGGRYDRHALLDHYAREKLRGEDAARARARHVAYFVRFLQERRDEARHGDPARALGAIDDDLANVRAAWRRAIDDLRIEAIGAMLDPLRLYFDMRTRFLEGRGWFEAASRRLDGASERHATLRGRLLVARAWLTHQAGGYATADTLAREAAAVLSSGEQPAESAKALNVLATLHWRRGRHADARTEWQRALAIAEAHAPADRASYRANLALAEHALGAYDRAAAHLEGALALAREANDPFHVVRTLTKLGVLRLDMDEPAAAERCFEEGLEKAREHGFDDAIARLEVNLGVAALRRGDAVEAGRLSRRALERASEGDDRALEAYALARLGKVHAALDDGARAMRYFARALRRGREMTEVQIEALHGVAGLRLAQGEPGAAVRLLSALAEHPAAEAPDKERIRRSLEAARRELPSDVADEAMRGGGAMSVDEAVFRTLEEAEARP